MIPYPHVIDDFMENYRLQHITLNNPPNFWLAREVTNETHEWYMCIVSKKFAGSGMIP